MLFTPQPTSGEIIIVKIDDESLNKVGQWPWPRETFGRLIRALNSASVIGIDVAFKEPSRLGDSDDIALENVFKSATVPIVLSVDIEADNKVALPLDRFIPHTYQGFSNVVVDSDGVVRFIETKRNKFSSFASAVSVLHGGQILSEETPFGNQDSVRISYHGRNNTYPSFSVIDVINGKAPDLLIDDKIVLVGVTASDIKNFYQTPFGLMSGVEIQANAIDTFLDEVSYTFNPWVSVGLIFALSFIVIWISVRIRNTLWLLLAVFGIFAFYSMIAFFSFGNFFILDLLYPGLAIVGTALIFNTSQYVATARKERNLRKSFNYLNAMVESMAEGIIMTDTHCKISVINPAAKQILGLAHNKTLSAINLSDIVNEKHKIKDKIEESITSNKILKIDEVLIGGKFFQIFTAPVKTTTETTENGLLGGVIIFHDITSKKEIEKIREDYTSMLVHELRSPLDGIKKMTATMITNDMLKKEKDLCKEYIALIHDGSAQMLELVNDLLDVAKIEAGKLDINKESADIQQIVENRISFFKVPAQNVRVELSACYDENIPKKINLDPIRISQVFNNLISNALKFTDAGGKVVIDVFYHEKGRNVKEEAKKAGMFPLLNKDVNKISDSLIIAVTNTGPAISREALPRLFSKFKQFEAAAKTSAKGTGLGLVIAKGIVEGHGGIIGAESKEGIGSTFYFTIPV